MKYILIGFLFFISAKGIIAQNFYINPDCIGCRQEVQHNSWIDTVHMGDYINHYLRKNKSLNGKDGNLMLGVIVDTNNVAKLNDFFNNTDAKINRKHIEKAIRKVPTWTHGYYEGEKVPLDLIISLKVEDGIILDYFSSRMNSKIKAKYGAHN